MKKNDNTQKRGLIEKSPDASDETPDQFDEKQFKEALRQLMSDGEVNRGEEYAKLIESPSYRKQRAAASLKNNPFYKDLLQGNLKNIPDDETLAKMMPPEELELFKKMRHDFYIELYKEYQTRSFWRKALGSPKIAAVLVFLLVATTGVSVYYRANPVTATKQFFDGIQSKFIGQPAAQIGSLDEWERAKQIYSMDNIDKMIAFYPGLRIPEYIPEGYSLQKLEISKKATQDYYAAWYYFQKHETESFLIYLLGDEISVTGTISEEEKILILEGLKCETL